MEKTKGGICVETEHIFPIIKKWLYSEKDIFLREIVSNACDACTKLKRLYSLGEAKDVDTEAFRIDVELNLDEGYVRVSDNGIGMSADEVSRYLNQIALSGALDFIEKYDEQNGAEGIIGHFGLGFYSAFMVSERVTVETKSYTDAPAVSWECNAEGRYQMSEGAKESRGTEVTMYISEEEKEFLSSQKISDILSKYCTFLPVPVYFAQGESECKCEHGEGEECDCHVEKPINDTAPLWTKAPSDCTKQDYLDLYTKLTGDYREPLFYVHINADYPLNFKGILYFPKHEREFEDIEPKVKLYYNQVYVADNIKEVVPDYMIMLRGVLDCPELPLNVSRSYLQNDAYTKKISQHIAKKVADKICSLFNTEREALEKIWDEVKPFVLYASLRDEKFYEKVKGATLFKTCTDKYLSIEELSGEGKDKGEKLFYTTDRKSQAQYVSLLTEQGVPVAEFDTVLETQYVAMLEQKNSELKFARVDAELPELLSGEGEELSKEDTDKICELFKALVSEGDEVKVGNLKNSQVPAVLTVSEESRRFNDMLKMYRGAGGEGALADLPENQQLVLNASNPLVRALAGASGETAEAIARQVLALAKLARRPLTPEEAAEFSKTACELYSKLI